MGRVQNEEWEKERGELRVEWGEWRVGNGEWGMVFYYYYLYVCTALVVQLVYKIHRDKGTFNNTMQHKYVII